MDMHHFAVVDIVAVGSDLLEELKVLADHGGNVFDRINVSRASLHTAFCRAVLQELVANEIIGLQKAQFQVP